MLTSDCLPRTSSLFVAPDNKYLEGMIELWNTTMPNHIIPTAENLLPYNMSESYACGLFHGLCISITGLKGDSSATDDPNEYRLRIALLTCMASRILKLRKRSIFTKAISGLWKLFHRSDV